MQTRQEKIKALYQATYDELQLEDIEETPLEDMEEDLTAYYRAAGFDIEKIDELLEAKEVEDEVADVMKAQMEAVRARKALK